MGRSDLRAVESSSQAFMPMLKADAWPNSLVGVQRWQSDALLFRAQARRAFSPSMRQRIDVDGLYSDAVRALPTSMDAQPPQPVSQSWPMTLDELLAA